MVGDGVADGVIGDPLACDFDFTSLVGQVTPCGETFTDADAAVLEKIRQGPRRTSGEFQWYGLVEGAPYAGLSNTALVNGELVGQPFPFVTLVIAYWLEMNPAWDWRTETYESFEQHIDQMVELYDDVHGASDPDIRAFHDSGGKLLVWHGWSDFGVYAQGTLDWYERVQDILGPGRTKQAVRVFLAPGVDHCGGGPGAQPTGQLEALIEWVEKGHAPKQLLATRAEGGSVVATRPICDYPTVAKYKGSGDVNDAQRYRCVPAEQLTPRMDP
nr:tannase/feruloyl esterase family alpha/beta hydrolase [Microbacterium immunditiarum]